MRKKITIIVLSLMFLLLLVFVCLRLGYIKIGLQETPSISVLYTDEKDGIQPLQMRGPKNEPPVGVEVLVDIIRNIDLKEFKKKRYKAAICMHYGYNDWSKLQIQGINDTLKKFDVEVILETNGELDADKQIADYQNVIAAKPDVIITIPVDSVKTAPILRKAAQKGIKIVFMDTIPEGFIYPDDYVGMVIADSYANSRIAVKLLVDRLGGKGKVAMIHWKSKMFTTDQRTLAARETFAEYKDIEVVAEESFLNFHEVDNITRKLLKKYPDLSGIWVVWDIPALEVVKVIRETNSDVAVATMDLGYKGAMAIAQGDVLIGIGAEHPYQQGVAEAIMAVAALAGKKVPSYVVIPGEKVTAELLPQAWKRVFQTPLPKSIRSELQKLEKTEPKN